MRPVLFFFAAVVVTACALAQTPPPPAKRLPPAGIAISEKDRAELTAGAAALRQEIDALQRERSTDLRASLADVEIFHKAVDWALRYDEFFAPKETATARKFLAEGHDRVAQLRAGKAPWLDATGLIVRGYRSKLDDSVQPYGLFVPANLKKDQPNRLEVWLLGRGEKRTELAFLAEREGGPPQLVPKDTIVLIPYGRFCNATKFAGEVDVFEAMDAVRRNYQVDPLRTSVAGFSMGGASVWHLAVHHSDLWSSASPGAGFAETPIYTKAFAPGKEPPTWWEQKLWGWYDATLDAGNLFNCPTVAYSGEIDPQKQSADVMEEAMSKEGLKLERFIGPKTGHQYEPATKKELLARLEALADKGRDAMPREVRLSTYTLRDPEASWVRIEGMAKHWERADVTVRISENGETVVTTKNVTALSIRPNSATWIVDEQRLPWPSPLSSTPGFIVQENGKWRHANASDTKAQRKRPGITGPIDDAFMEPFVFVRPTGKPLNEKLGTWTSGELAHATKMWRDIFRGDAVVKDDSAISPGDIANKNLVLWGDPTSNKILAQILAKLPLTWDAKQLVFRGKTYDAAHHAPILIFPNPLNPEHYVVLNSGIDFRDHAYGTNALQIPKLPDYAIVDLDTPQGPRWPGKIIDAGFFDEEWK